MKEDFRYGYAYLRKIGFGCICAALGAAEYAIGRTGS